MQVEVVERAALLFCGGEFGQRTDSVEGQSQSNIPRPRFADATGENLLPPVHAFLVVGGAEGTGDRWAGLHGDRGAGGSERQVDQLGAGLRREESAAGIAWLGAIRQIVELGQRRSKGVGERGELRGPRGGLVQACGHFRA